LPSLIRESESKMNCIVGGWDVKNGFVTPNKLHIDTTNTRISAKGYLDLRSERVNLVFRPLPKRPQFFSLGIPMTVTGTFDDYQISTNVFQLYWFGVRIYHFTINYLLQGLWKKQVPIDGSDICIYMDP